MKKGYKELLLKDLCARLPYKVMVKDRNGIHELTPGNTEFTDLFDIYSDKCNIKPYLRSLSSMTEEEKQYIRNRWCYEDWCDINDVLNHYQIEAGDSFYFIEWLYEHHFDYRDLIEKDLAIEAPEGMYNF